jgi:hypothetical protein
MTRSPCTRRGAQREDPLGPAEADQAATSCMESALPPRPSAFAFATPPTFRGRTAAGPCSPSGPRRRSALGLVGKFWRPVISFAEASAEQFKQFSEPGYAKHGYSLGVSDLDQGTLLRAEMRVATTVEHARRWFRRYWTFGVGSGAHVLVNGVIELARDRAEEAAGKGAG